MSECGIRRLVAIVVGLWVGASSAAGVVAQPVFDPDRYVELSQTGQQRYADAIEEPAGSEQRRALLRESSDHLKGALAMVRAGIESRAIDTGRRAAMHDFFTLMENLAVVWIALDACRPAQRLVDIATSHPELRESDEALFDNLQPRLSACRERSNAWAWERYRGLVERAEQRHRQAFEGGGVDAALLEQAAAASLEALSIYREALLAGGLGAVPLDDPVAELLLRYDVTLTYQLDARDCDGAEATLAWAEADFQTPLWARRAEPSQAEQVPGCRAMAPLVLVEEAVEESEWPRLREAAGWALIGTSVVLGVGALVVDITSVDDRDELDALQSECAAGPCDEARAAALADAIDDRKVVTGVLIGAAVVAGVGGVVLLLTGDDDDRDPPDEPEAGDVSVGPAFWPAGGVGADLSLRF